MIASFCIRSHVLDFFPENALGDGPKNSRIRVKLGTPYVLEFSEPTESEPARERQKILRLFLGLL